MKRSKAIGYHLPALIAALVLMIAVMAAGTVRVHAEDAVTYDLKVKGVQVTSENAADVLGDGTVSYDEESNTLKLNGAAIVADSPVVKGVETGIDGLTIALQGDNTLTVNNTAASSGALRGINAEGKNLSITGDGSLHITINNDAADNKRDRDPKGIIANDLIIDGASVSIDFNGGREFTYPQTGMDEHWDAGISISQSMKINDSDVKINMPGIPKGNVIGIYGSVENTTLDITGKSNVDITMEAGEKNAYVISGISGRYVTGSPLYNRKLIGVTIANDSSVNVDTSTAIAENSNGCIYGYVTMKGSASLVANAGRQTFNGSDNNYSYGIGPFTQIVNAGGPEGSQYFNGLKMSGDTTAEITALGYGMFSSIDASGNAKVTVTGKEKSGLRPYQGVKAADNAEVIVSGAKEGIPGLVMATGDSVIVATGGTRALAGVNSPSDVRNGHKPFEPSTDNDGSSVHIKNHNSGNVEVNTKTTASGAKVWNGKDALYGDETQFKYVRIGKHEHVWDNGVVTTPATTTAKGVKTFTCTVCGETRTESIDKLPVSADEQMGEDGTPAGKGASAATVEKAIMNAKTDEGPAGTKFAPLRLKSTKQTKKSVKLTWTKANGAKKYVIYGNLCGKTKKMKKIGTSTGTSKTIKKAAGKKLKKGKYYKFIIVALDKNNKVVSTSRVVHVATKGGKVGNHKKVTVKKAVIKKAKKLKKGKTLKLKAKQVKASSKLKVKSHRKISYESSNKTIAAVSKSGVVTGKKKGTCYIYAFAQNGVYKKIKVTVK